MLSLRSISPAVRQSSGNLARQRVRSFLRQDDNGSLWAFDMATEIQESYDIYGKTEKGEIDRFSRYRLLIIDEIDKVEERKNARLLLEEVINKRYLAGMPVVAISNQPFNDMEKFVGSRVMSRLHENVFVSDFPWPDFRKQPVKP